MKLEFVKISPTQNMTILVKTPVDRDKQAEAAGKLMQYDNVFAEQAGFIEAAADKSAWARLQMMGGEFCGNAVMSLAAYLVFKKNEPVGSSVKVPLEASGADGIVGCLVSVKQNCYSGTVNIPVPEKIKRLSYPVDGKEYEFTTVFLQGITHVIIPADDLDDPAAFAGQAVLEWEPLIESDAFGAVLFDEKALRIDPLVRVKSANSTVWERGCGSGTAAVGCYLAAKRGRGVKENILQPGGKITVDVTCKGNDIASVKITGDVKIVAEGRAYI